MSGVNKAILLGHLGRDPEMRYMPDGKAIATLNIATSESFKDRDGNKQEKTEWHRVVFFGRSAEVAGEYLRKGGMAYVEGRLQTRKWTDKEGQERYTTEIVGDRLQLVGGRKDGGEYQDDQRASSAPQTSGNAPRTSSTPSSNAPRGSGGPATPFDQRPPADDYDDDIPF